MSSAHHENTPTSYCLHTSAASSTYQQRFPYLQTTFCHSHLTTHGLHVPLGTSAVLRNISDCRASTSLFTPSEYFSPTSFVPNSKLNVSRMIQVATENQYFDPAILTYLGTGFPIGLQNTRQRSNNPLFVHSYSPTNGSHSLVTDTLVN